MAAKTTSGSGFDFRFVVFYAIDWSKTSIISKTSKGHFLRHWGSKLKKIEIFFKKLLEFKFEITFICCSHCGPLALCQITNDFYRIIFVF